jgi:hypothetical protein
MSSYPLIYKTHLSINCIGDFERQARNELRRVGCKEKVLTKVRDIIDAWCNIQYRVIYPKPRLFTPAPGLLIPSRYESGFRSLQNDVELGNLLTPYLSKSILEPDYSDMLLNDWGLHHFHLNPRLKQQPFVERSKYILVALTTDRNFYALHIAAHGDWYSPRYLNTVWYNWREELGRFMTSNQILPLANETEDFATVRKKHVNQIFPLPGNNAVFPPGGEL